MSIGTMVFLLNTLLGRFTFFSHQLHVCLLQFAFTVQSTNPYVACDHSLIYFDFVLLFKRKIMAEPLAGLMRQRQLAERAIYNRHDRLFDDEHDIERVPRAELLANKKQLENDFSRWDDANQQVIQTLEDDDVQNAYDYTEEVRGTYFAAWGKIEAALGEGQPLANSTMNATNLATMLQGNVIRVETARTPEPGEFSGKPAEWPAFRDRFNAEVHHRDNLDDVTKLIYLQRACVGIAKASLGEWQPIAINYQKAWQTLQERYEDRYQLRHALLSKLINIPRVEKETHDGLRSIIDGTCNTIRQVEAMGVEVDQWGPLLMTMVVGKLPRRTADAWEQKRETHRDPTFEELISFLEGKARGRAYLDTGAVSDDNRIPHGEAHHGGRSHRHDDRQERHHDKRGNRYHSNDRRHYGNHRSSDQQRQTSHNNPSDQRSGAKFICHQCKGGHTLFRCGQFRALPIAERRRVAEQAKVCLNCLGVHYGACKYGPCLSHPKEFHNSLLCEKSSKALVAVTTALEKRTAKKSGHRYQPYQQ